MAGLGIRTKKVTTYGKKRTGVVALYHDDNLLTPTKNDIENDWVTTHSHNAAPSTPTAKTIIKPTTKRAPLTSKLSNDLVNLPPTTPQRVSKKGSKTISVSSDGSDVVLLDPKKPKAAVVKAKAPKPRLKGIVTPRKPVLDGVILPSTKSSTRNVSNSTVSISAITDDVSHLSIESPNTATPLEEFNNLVSACTLTKVHDFSTFISSSDVVSLLDPENQASGPSFKKIGEASYSEVYSMGIQKGKKIVIKVIPLVGHDHNKEVVAEVDAEDLPDTSYARDVLRELEITQRMGGVEGATSRFVNFLGAYVVKGKYPEVLVDEWWTFKTSVGSSSACPESFGDNQHYALVVLADGGVDLESFQFDSTIGWKQAAGVFWQAVDALAQAEEFTSFEHRDLHEGQILIAPSPMSASSSNLDCLSESQTGVKVTIIDFGLSRLSLPGKASSTWSDLPTEVYEGKGDQWDVYREMRDQIAGDWEGFHPETNVLWLHYIVRYLLNRTKSLRKPRQIRPARKTRTDVARKSDIIEPGVLAAYECLRDVEECMKAGTGLGSAKDLLDLGRSRGWIGKV